jgi:hypothetical protein
MTPCDHHHDAGEEQRQGRRLPSWRAFGVGGRASNSPINTRRLPPPRKHLIKTTELGSTIGRRLITTMITTMLMQR